MACSFVLSTLFLQAAVEPFDDRRGPYAVGQQTVILIDRSRDSRRLITEIWYPRASAGASAPRETPGLILGSPDRYRLPSSVRETHPDDSAQTVRNAPAAPGRFPVVLFSHGLTAIRTQSRFLTEFWASHGFVVVAPDHQGNTGYDFNPLKLYQSGLDRPRDLRFVLDQLAEMDRLASWELSGRIRLDRVAAAGHSLGGYTALASAGAWIHVRELPVQLDTDSRPDYREISDPRIACVVALAPVCKPAFTPLGLSHMTRPTLIVGGTADTVTPFEEHQRPIFQGLGGRAVLARIEGASHFSFADEDLLIDAPFFVRAMHRPTIDRGLCDRILRSITVRFLVEQLKSTNHGPWA